MQCTAGIFAARACFAILAAWGIIGARAASGRCGETALPPRTPFWHSCVTTAAAASSTSGHRQDVALQRLALLEHGLEGLGEAFRRPASLAFVAGIDARADEVRDLVAPH